MAELSARSGPIALARLSRRRNALAVVWQYVGEGLTYALLVLIGVGMVLPFVWTISQSLQPTQSLLSYPIRWIPDPVTLDAYTRIWTTLPFARMIVNTFFIAMVSTAGYVFTCALAAYGFARLRFPGREVLFTALLATMMIPFAVTLIPLFVIMKTFGWLDTYLPLIVPRLFGGAYGVFLLRQFLLTLPRELEDAARIDGSSTFGIFIRISIPLIKPALATLGTFAFLSSWNDFLWPLVVLNTYERFTIQLGLSLLRGTWNTDWAMLLAGTSLAIIPILVVFFSLQKYFVQGIALTGLKG
ncbi:MAG: carbohydrate ABC transporter permease [Chloroflexi bacterium]|nr:carbohydrate ABC transporter permease [Chloroflexota bacterium]